MAKCVNTMWLFRNKILIGLFSLLSFQIHAQLVEVKDSVLRSYICTKFPLAMNASCTLLDTVKASASYSKIHDFRIVNNKVKSADEVLYFKNADTIYLNQNQLSSFPDDLSSFRSLGRLNLARNLLTKAPNIHYKSWVSGVDTAVKLVYLQYNQIAVLPESWFKANPFTQVIDISGNELTDIPTFTDYPQIRRLDVRENRLAFEELIPLLSHPNWGVFPITLFPQKPFPLALDSIVDIGDTIKIDVSTGLSSNEYILLKNNSNFITNRTGKFEIVIKDTSDIKQYWVKIRNDNFASESDFLKSEFINLKLNPTENVKENDVFVFSPDDDGHFDSFLIEGEGDVIIYDKSGTAIRKEHLPFRWYGKDKHGAKVSPSLYLLNKNGQLIKVLVAY